MPSAGFLVISIVAILLVIVPSVVLVVRIWCAWNNGKIVATLVSMLFVAFGWVVFIDSETADFESRAFSFYVICGFILYAYVALYAFFRLISGFLNRRKP